MSMTGEVKAQARIVVRGDQETRILLPQSIHAPVGEIITLRTLCSFAVQQGWRIAQAYVSTAFLNTKLSQEVYLRLPHGEQR